MSLLDVAIKTHAPSIKPRPKARRKELRWEFTSANDDVCVAANGLDKRIRMVLEALDALKAHAAKEGKSSALTFKGRRQSTCSKVEAIRGVLETAQVDLALIVEMSAAEGEAELRKANGNG